MSFLDIAHELLSGHNRVKYSPESGMLLHDPETAVAAGNRIWSVERATSDVYAHQARTAGQHAMAELAVRGVPQVDARQLRPQPAPQEVHPAAEAAAYTLNHAVSRPAQPGPESSSVAPGANDYARVIEQPGLSAHEAAEMERRAFAAADSYPTSPAPPVPPSREVLQQMAKMYEMPDNQRNNILHEQYIDGLTESDTAGRTPDAQDTPRPDNNIEMAEDARVRIQAAHDRGEGTDYALAA